MDFSVLFLTLNLQKIYFEALKQRANQIFIDFSGQSVPPFLVFGPSVAPPGAATFAYPISARGRLCQPETAER